MAIQAQIAEKTKGNTAMKDVMEEEMGLFRFPKQGDMVEGVIIAKLGNAVYVDLGMAGTGIIYGREYYEAQSELKGKNVGDALSAKVVEFENENGLRELSMSAAGKENNWQKLERMRDTKELIEVKIKAANRGGLIIEKDGVEGFMPVSQLSPNNYPRVEGGDKEKILRELQKFVNKTTEVRILDVDQRQRKFIVSEKAGEEEAIKKALEKYKVGDTVEGEITGVVEFGAFIRLDPLVEGLIHISELDWQLVERPQNVVTIGERVKVKVIDITQDGRVSLSIKALKDDPWKDVNKKYLEGSSVKGVVSKINSYGALVKVDEVIQGLVHISEFSSEEDMKSKLQEGNEYQFKIAQIVPQARRMTLKMA